MKVVFNKRYATVSVYIIITFAVCLLLVEIVQKFSLISGYLKTIAGVLAPITWGIVIAYILNPVMMFIERLLKKLLDKNKPHPKTTRGISAALSLILLISVLTAIIAILLPQVLDSVVGIATNVSTYLTNFETWIYKFVENYPEVSRIVEEQFDTLQPKLMDYVNNLIPKLADMAVKVKDGAIVFVLGLKDFLIGLIVSIYLLCSKERFIAQMRKLIIALFPSKVSKGIFNVSSHTNHTLGGFISGKLLDSLLIGVLTFICMTIMKMDFIALISVVIGVTNIIPFFGPFIGAIPSAFLLLVAAPKQVIPFVIFIIILQQFDGNILGPKILGDSTGLSAFWVMFAIFIGGGLFGFAGMLLGVPFFAVVYSLVSDFLNFLLTKKGLSTNTNDYFAEIPERPKHRSTPSLPHVNIFNELIKHKKNTEQKDDELSDTESNKEDQNIEIK